MHLLPEPLFSIPTDNTYIMNIVGTDTGRIFMAGKDGCLYELAYQVIYEQVTLPGITLTVSGLSVLESQVFQGSVGHLYAINL